MANHRGLRIPAALCQVNADYIISFDMGYGENFLEPYMTPKQKECFVDIGTSAGGGTFIVARKCFEVYAFEPNPKAYNILNSRAKNYRKVHVYSYTLGEQDTIGCLGTSGASI
ncbi:MAG: hypothetical protein WC046_09400, partial [Candidatus Bathyarchaeia archaeon]